MTYSAWPCPSLTAFTRNQSLLVVTEKTWGVRGKVHVCLPHQCFRICSHYWSQQRTGHSLLLAALLLQQEPLLHVPHSRNTDFWQWSASFIDSFIHSGPWLVESDVLKMFSSEALLSNLCLSIMVDPICVLQTVVGFMRTSYLFSYSTMRKVTCLFGANGSLTWLSITTY